MNKNFIKSLALSIALLFTSSIPVFADINVSRISGYDRYETSINANKKYMNQANGNLAVIASGNDFKTALYGSYMASSLNVPYFVNPKHGVRTDILNELKRLKVNRVYIMGDYNILDKSVDNTLESKGIKIERMYDGKKFFNLHGSCYGMSLPEYIDIIIFNTFHYGENKGDISMGIFINDEKFPDLLSVIPLSSSLARTEKRLLANSNSLIYDNSNFIIGGGLIIGGYDSVPSNIMTFEGENWGLYDHSYYDEYTGKIYHDYTGRIAGQNRYETAVEIAKAYKTMFNKGTNTVVLVNGENYPDALSSSLVATQNNGAVLLTQPNKLNENTAKYIKDNSIKNIIIVGGEKSVSRNVENELKTLN